MSRSALERENIPPMYTNNVMQNNYQQMIMPGGAPSMYYGGPMMMPMQMIPQQPFVPIRLNGDDEDNEDPTFKKNVLPVHGNSETFNMNSLLFNNILSFEYFRALFQLKTYHEVIDEVYRSVKHVEPWQTGTTRIPSTAFCLLVKFLLMKLTIKQMNGLLTTDDCPFLRAMGFLYLRYTCEPKDLWKWYEPYLEDEEEFQPSSDKTVKMTVGEFCIKLLSDMQYYSTTFPRIPVPIERKIKVMLLLLEDKRRRRRTNMRDIEFFRPKTKVKAVYGDEENEPAWYEAVIDRIDKEETNKYWVTFTEYGNSECVDLGDMELLNIPPQQQKNNASPYHNRTSSRSRDRSYDDNKRRKNSPDNNNNRYSNNNDNNNDRGDYNQNRRSSRDRSYENTRYGRSRSRENRDRRSRSYERTSGRNDANNNNNTTNLLDKVLKSEREASAAVGIFLFYFYDFYYCNLILLI
jgi:pre-mRNA-splicing factor 38B